MHFQSKNRFSVRTVLMSVISLLNEPNTSSPANVDASVMYRKWKETNGKDEEYSKIVRYVSTNPIPHQISHSFRKQVEATKAEAEKDGVKVPETVDDYCVKSKPNKHDDVDMLDFDDDYYDYGADSGWFSLCCLPRY